MENQKDEIQENGVQLVSEMPSYYLQQKAQIDVQIATAHAFPRSLSKCKDNAVTIVTLSKEIAKSCGYSLPRGKKPIKGATVHLARILAQNYGNMRVSARVSEVSEKYVSALAVALDLETNLGVELEIRRKILYSDGRRFNDVMIHTTGLAAAAVAYRNVVLSVIPKGLTDHVYKAAQDHLTGDLSSEQELLKARAQWIKHFKSKYEATDEEIITLCGVKTLDGIKRDQILTLAGTDQAIKDEDTTAN